MKSIKNSSFIIEKLTPEQAVILAPEIVSIYRDSWIATYPNEEFGISEQDIKERFNNFEELVEDWKKNILSSENRSVWVAKDQTERVVGFCIAKKDKETNELEYIYLLPGWEGRGIGRALINNAIEWLGSLKPIVLYGAAYNDNAIKFYERFGFHLSNEQIPPKMLPSGKGIPSMKMVKEQTRVNNN